MEVRLHRLQESDAESLFHFEVENRSFFNKMVPDRGEDYYEFQTFNDKLLQLITEQSLGLSTFYLVKDENGTIIGRINLVDFNYSNENVELGYRISEDQSGKGMATLGVKRVLDEVYHQNKIKHISARTTKDNLASQKVLESNGFTYISTDPEEVLLNGGKVNLMHYRWSKE